MGILSAMASAADVSVGVSGIDSENNEKESGFSTKDVQISSMSKPEIEQLIFAEIRKLKGSKKRPDRNIVCSGIEKRHGLAQSATRCQLDKMICQGKIERLVVESLNIPKPLAINKLLIPQNTMKYHMIYPSLNQLKTLKIIPKQPPLVNP